MLSQRVTVEAASHEALRDRLLAEMPGLDAETLADTLEGITNLREVLAELVRSALEDESLVTALSARLADMRARVQRIGNRAAKKRALALKAMAEADLKTVVEPDFTATLRRGAPTLDVFAEERVPDAYWKPQPSKLDRQGLLTALKGGTEIAGVALAEPELQLSVRTK